MAIQVNDIISWSITASLRSAYSASVNLIDPNGNYDRASLQNTLITIRTDCTAGVFNGTGTAGSFSGNIEWVRGIISGVTENEALSERVSQLQVKSYFARLGRKPIFTESDLTNSRNAMERMCSVYAAVPEFDSANPTVKMYDFSETTQNPVIGPFNANSTLEALRMAAQGGYSNLYVSANGYLRSAAWKDASDPLEITIPDEAIISASAASNDTILPTRLKIRGAFFTTYDFVQDMNSAGGDSGGGTPPDQSAPIQGGGGMSRGPIDRCFKNGIGEAAKKVDVKAVDGEDADIKNANIEMDGYDVSEVQHTSDNEVTFMASESGSNWVDEGTDGTVTPDVQSTVLISGRKRNKGDLEDPEVKNAPANAEDGARDKKDAEEVKELGKGTILVPVLPARGGPGPAGGAGSAGGGGNKSPDKITVEESEVQLEMYLQDNDLYAEFGHVTEELENKTVPGREQLHDILVRRFQELKMQRNAWQLQLAYLPQLAINQVVQFTTPKKSLGGQKVVTGLLTQLTVNNNSADMKTSMTAVVESFEDIGATTYISNNLIKDTRLVGYGGNSNWVQSGVGRIGAGFIKLFVKPNTTGSGFVRVDQYNLEVGASYTIRFSIVGYTSGPLDFYYGAATTSYNTGGTKAITFTATSSVYSFKWGVTNGNPAGRQQWYVNQISLYKTSVK